jgi:hypothetical protein
MPVIVLSTPVPPPPPVPPFNVIVLPLCKPFGKIFEPPPPPPLDDDEEVGGIGGKFIGLNIVKGGIYSGLGYEIPELISI